MFDRALSLLIRLAAGAVMLGWLLSALGQLRLQGYLLFGPPLMATLLLACRCQADAALNVSLRRWWRRWKRPQALPWIFALTFLLIVIGSACHEPNNFDGLSYRAPKVLNWLAEHRWHWIHSPFQEVNYTLPNYEWLTAPLILLTDGLRGTVVINWIGFLLTPSLFFSLLRSWGASGRAARDWMWLLPSGYLIAMQAGGIGNDLCGLVAVLAALHCANRFVVNGRPSYLLDAALASGFFTGVKLSNLPLLVPVLIVLAGNWPLLRARMKALWVAAGLGATVSALIPLLLNLAHAGSILGARAGTDQTAHPVAGVFGNALMMLSAALEPPVLPGANGLTTRAEHLLGDGLLSWLRLHYDKFSLRLNELPQEESGALGLGITLALVVSVILWLRTRPAATVTPAPTSRWRAWQRLAWWGWLGFSGLVLFAKLGTGPAFPRNLLPWYPLLLAPWIARFCRAQVVRRRAWRLCATLAALSVLPPLLLAPARPVIPPAAVYSLAQAAGAGPALLERLHDAYELYAERADPFAPLTRELPAGVLWLGVVSDGVEPTAAWWKPFGARRCVSIVSEADLLEARRRGVEYLMVKQRNCREFFGEDAALWLARHHARELKTIELRQYVRSTAMERYTLARFEDAPL